MIYRGTIIYSPHYKRKTQSGREIEEHFTVFERTAQAVSWKFTVHMILAVLKKT
jgi:hypothetical protein